MAPEGVRLRLQLVMSGVSNFALYDNQVLGEENVIRHACGLRYVGQKEDRSVGRFAARPQSCTVNAEMHDLDLMTVPDLEDRVRAAERRGACNRQ